MLLSPNVEMLNDQSREGIFVAYATASKLYKLIGLESRDVVASREVTFK